ncbi:VOC family protein [Streptomyces sp. NPDC057367]|uniref:VOC family protein n=1 Tax=Streptomyces sp. NPDC057367 TaxID=3346108 RepID=UPI003644FB83
MNSHPRLLQTVLDTTDPRRLAEFYRQLLGLTYRPGDEPPADGVPEEPDWLVLRTTDGANRLAFQLVDRLPRTTWPVHDVPMQAHLDLTVPAPGNSPGSA